MRLPFRQRKRRKPMSKFAAGLIGIIVLAVFVYGGFTKFANPFASHFTIHAVVPSSNDLRPNSLVRIAGVNVGKVSSVESVNGSQASEVTMTIDSNTAVPSTISTGTLPRGDAALNASVGFARSTYVAVNGTFFSCSSVVARCTYGHTAWLMSSSFMPASVAC